MFTAETLTEPDCSGAWAGAAGARCAHGAAGAEEGLGGLSLARDGGQAGRFARFAAR